jgi:hypothetical protein
MAKGQMRSNREAKKPKKSTLEKQKAKAGMSSVFDPAAKTQPAYPKKK